MQNSVICGFSLFLTRYWPTICQSVTLVFFSSFLFWPFSLKSCSKKPLEQTTGREVHEIFALLNKPWKVKLSMRGKGIKRVQNYVHVVFERPYCQVLVVTNANSNNYGQKQNIRAERTMSKRWYRVKNLKLQLYEISILNFWSKPRNTHSFWPYLIFNA